MATQVGGTDGLNDGTVQKMSIVGNYYIDETYRGDYLASYPITVYRLGTGSAQFYTGSEVYVDDNYCNSEEFSPCYVSLGTGTEIIDAGVSDPITWPTGLATDKLASGDVKTWVLQNVGARPMDRDTVDTDIIANVTNETGTIINCVEYDTGFDGQDCTTAGTYAYTTRPALAENTRSPSISTLIPASPNADYGDGRTNLEHFLESYSDALEGQESIIGISGSGSGTITGGGSGTITGE